LRRAGRLHPGVLGGGRRRPPGVRQHHRRGSWRHSSKCQHSVHAPWCPGSICVSWRDAHLRHAACRCGCVLGGVSQRRAGPREQCHRGGSGLAAAWSSPLHCVSAAAECDRCGADIPAAVHACLHRIALRDGVCHQQCHPLQQRDPLGHAHGIRHALHQRHPHGIKQFLSDHHTIPVRQPHCFALQMCDRWS